MRKFVRPDLGFVIFFSALITFALWGWHELATILPDPLGLFTKPDKQWIIETLLSVSVCLFINLCQINTNLLERVWWGLLFSASVSMLFLIFKTGWQGALTNFIMQLPIVGDGMQSAMIVATIPKAVEVNAIVLFFGKISGIIEIDIPKSQLLSGPIHPFDEGWRQY